MSKEFSIGRRVRFVSWFSADGRRRLPPGETRLVEGTVEGRSGGEWLLVRGDDGHRYRKRPRHCEAVRRPQAEVAP